MSRLRVNPLRVGEIVLLREELAWPLYRLGNVALVELEGKTADGQIKANSNRAAVLFQRIWHKSRVRPSNSLLPGKWQRGLPKL